MGEGQPTISRRALLKGATGLAVLWPVLPALAGAAHPVVPVAEAAPGLAGLIGERLEFRVGFWIFSQAGYVKTALLPLAGTANRFEATMIGQTAGVIGFFTRYRKDTYRSVMELAGGRLRPLEFSEEVIVGKEVRRRRTTSFDYARQVMVRQKRQGAKVESEEFPMAPGTVYDDYLSGLYNFRAGLYGPLRQGSTFVLNVPRNKGGRIRLELCGPEETRRLLSRERATEAKAYYCRVFMDKDALKSGNGRLGGWFSAAGVPMGGVMEDVALFGDITGTLVSRQVASRV